jgi:hypothetical protein
MSLRRLKILLVNVNIWNCCCESNFSTPQGPEIYWKFACLQFPPVEDDLETPPVELNS